ncbi:MAG: MCE family protein [Bacteroidales bacterium]|nr:MCE family protein [Bacteroidales bacterium]HPD95281.1 MlaD family protein [Tenuifilaceae bacterium]HRX30573.1 MlaD family protein [Tenuifilaceae bacterium]
MKLKVTREAKIGIFATLILFGMFWGINFLKGKNIFSKNDEYYAIFSSVDGLKNTNDVLINGFKVGLVKNIEFNDIRSGQFKVTLLIGKKYQIPKRTIAKLISTNVMGGKAIKLEVSADSAYFQPGDTLPSSIETGLIDQLGHQMVPIKQKAEELMVEFTKTLKIMEQVFNEENRAQLSQGIANLNSSLKNVSNISASLDTMLNTPNGKIKNTLENVAAISQNLRNNNKNLNKIIQNFSSLSDSLAQSNLPQTVHKLDSSLIMMKDVLNKINSGQGTLGMLVNNDTLYKNLENASNKLDLLLNDIKNNPKRYVNFSVIDLSRTKYIEEKSQK